MPSCKGVGTVITPTSKSAQAPSSDDGRNAPLCSTPANWASGTSSMYDSPDCSSFTRPASVS
jgi:hypothetical protein